MTILKSTTTKILNTISKILTDKMNLEFKHQISINNSQEDKLILDFPYLHLWMYTLILTFKEYS